MRGKLTVLGSLLLLLLLSAFSAWGGDIDSTFQHCNGLASRGEDNEAIGCYEDLIQQQGYAPGLLFNLGNSYSHAGQIGRAILSYERALRLTPEDTDIKANLQQVRKEHGLFAPEQTKWGRLLHILGLHQWSLLALAAGILFCLACSYMLVMGNSRRIARPLAVLSLVVLLPSLIGIMFHLKQYNPSVVTAADEQLLISPFEGAQSLGSLQEGKLVFVEKSHGSYLRVRDRSGRTGWVEANALVPVCN